MSPSPIPTPYYLMDATRLRANMEKVARLAELSGAKPLLALKCFATWSVFDLMRPYMAGTTSSSLLHTFTILICRQVSPQDPAKAVSTTTNIGKLTGIVVNVAPHNFFKSLIYRFCSNRGLSCVVNCYGINPDIRDQSFGPGHRRSLSIGAAGS